MKESNNQYRKQIFVCCNTKADGSGCGPKGAEALRENLKTMVREKGLNREIRVVKSGCLDYCTQGIAAVIYPEGKTFTEISPADADGLMDELLK